MSDVSPSIDPAIESLRAAVAAIVAEFSTHVSDARIRSQMTYRELTDRSGLDGGYWRKLERGAVEPRLSNLLLIQHGLALDMLEPLVFRSSGDALRAAWVDGAARRASLAAKPR